MYSFYLKRLTPKDIGLVYSLSSSQLGEKCLPKDLFKLIYNSIFEDKNRFLVSVYNGNRMAGYAYARHNFSVVGGHYSEVIDFVTNDYYRKRGADIYLLKSIEQWSQQIMCDSIRVNADSDNTVSLLAKLNYTKDDFSQYYIKRL